MKYAVKLIPAKTSPDSETEWLPLVTHLLDVAAVMQELVECWLPKCVSAMLGFSADEFQKVTIFLALAHDLGKCTPVFVHKLLPRLPDLKIALYEERLEIPAQMLNGKDTPHAHAGAALLRRAKISESVAAVIGAHHGRPETEIQIFDDDIKDNAACYFGNEQSYWAEAQAELIKWALDKAGYENPEDVPEFSPPVQMLLTGLVIMADWIASNTKYFPLISTECVPQEYDLYRAKQALDTLDLPTHWQVNDEWKNSDFFQTRFGFEPNSIQQAVIERAATMLHPGCLILEAPMGIGKTEAALAAAEIWMDRFQLGGVEFFLPSQATGNAMFSRLLSWVKNMPHSERISVELAHAMADMNDEFTALQQGKVIVGQDEPETITVHSFFRGKKTRLLAELVVGTIDQMLMAGLKQKHVMLRHLGLVGKVAIIDECHAYDAYMNCYLNCVLSWLGVYGVPVILLSATLPEKRRIELAEAYLNRRKRGIVSFEEKQEAYPMITWTESGAIHQQAVMLSASERVVKITLMKEAEMVETVAKALKAGGCIGVIVNTVRRAQALTLQFAEMLPEAIVLLDHSQFLAEDRSKHEKKILERTGKHSDDASRRSVLVVGTQVLEQSLDLDFDLLVSDLCPMDLLLQRAGRLHRHNRMRPKPLSAAQLIVLNTEDILESGAKAIYGEYLLCRTRDLLPDKFSIPQDVSSLVQDTYDEMRWEPDVTEVYKHAKKEFKEQTKQKEQKAKIYRIDRPWATIEGTIAGMLDADPGITDAQARAAVRDGESSIEVLVLGQTKEGALLLSGEHRGEVLSMADTPCMEDARKIAGQRLRLPQRFAKPYMADRIIEYLEEQTCKTVPEWRWAPMLDGELFLFLNEVGEGKLPGYKLYYNAQMGLTFEEDKNGDNRV